MVRTEAAEATEIYGCFAIRRGNNMDPVTISLIINGVMRLAGLAVAEYPKVQAMLARLKESDKPITVEELDALIEQVDAKNEAIQGA